MSRVNESDAWNPTRASILASIWIVILLSIPLWWETTAVKRAPLPFDQISAWQSYNVLKSGFHVHIHLSLKPTSLPVESIAHEVETSLGEIFKDDAGQQVLNFKVSSETLQSQSNGHYEFQLSCNESLAVPSIHVRDDRKIIAYTSKCAVHDISLLVIHVVTGLFATEQKSYWADRQSDHDAMREVQYAPEYKLSFNLLNADPENLIIDWNIKNSIEEHFQPFLDAVSELARFDVSSQIQHYATLPIQPELSEIDGKVVHTLRPSALPLFINSAEWNLASVVSAAPPLNFLLYIPPLSQSPLHVLTSDGSLLATNAFLIPRWGGIVIGNPPRNQSTYSYSVSDLRPIMEIYVAQIRALLGIKEAKLLKADQLLSDYQISYSPSPIGVTGWELDTLQRQTTVKNMNNAIATLGSLSNLIQSMENMVVLDHIQKLVVSSLEALDAAKKALTVGNSDVAFNFAKTAVVSAEEAFFHPTMVSLLYFPDEHKYAVYMPLFTPIAVPLIIALIKEIRGMLQRRGSARRGKSKVE